MFFFFFFIFNFISLVLRLLWTGFNGGGASLSGWSSFLLVILLMLSSFIRFIML